LARRNAYKLVYIKERIAHLKDLEQQEASGTFDLLTKKEAALRRKELTKITSLRWYKTMGGLPDVAIIIDQKREMTAIRECQKLEFQLFLY
jgi:small subunit ribosomal protein S2